MYDFRIGYRYTFSTHAPAIIGQTFKDAELTAIVDYTTAMLFSNVQLSHIQVLPYLPTGSATDPTKNTYLVFKTTSGTTIVLSYTWIVESSINYSASMNITAIIHDARPDDALKIKQILALAGFNKVSITTGT